MTRRYTADYVEHEKLRDGTPVLLRLVKPEDKDLVRRGFDRLSPESRYTRFFAPKERLTDEELHYLCDIDQEAHFALGAIREDGDDHGRPIGLGIARFVRLPGRPGEPVTAEAAIAVTDDVQHLGLGRILFTRLVAAAVERGIEHFRVEVLCSNPMMKQLIERIAPSRTLEVSQGVYSIDFALPQMVEPPSPLYLFFQAAARGELALARGRRL